jgi:hypothetical protein
MRVMLLHKTRVDIRPLSNTMAAVRHLRKSCSVREHHPTRPPESHDAADPRRVPLPAWQGPLPTREVSGDEPHHGNAGQGNMRLMTDFSGERYWRPVAELERPGMAEFEKMMQGEGMSEADTKEFERLMEGRNDHLPAAARAPTPWRRGSAGRTDPGPAGGVSSLALAQGSPKASPIVPRFRRSRGLPYPSSSARERNNLAFSSGDSSGITAKGRLEEI